MFIQGAAPEETVEVEIVQSKKRHHRARVITVVEPGPARVTPTCEVFERCGGCVLQHVSLQSQLQSKRAAVRSAIERIGRVQGAVEGPPWTGDGYGYRTRARLFVAPSGAVGFRAAGSHEVVGIERCPIAAAPINAGIAALHTAELTNDEVQQVELVSVGKEALMRLPTALESDVDAASLPSGVRLVGSGDDETLEHDDGHGPMRYAPDVFAQANLAGNQALVSYVDALLSRLETEDALELYAGSGNFTRVLARRAPKVRAVESSRSATRLAKRILPGHVHLDGRTVEIAMRQVTTAPSLVLVDPPRAGLSKEVAGAIDALAPAAMIYVSCDPATFARDLTRLPAMRLEEYRVFDLYPQTAHVELAALLVRRA